MVLFSRIFFVVVVVMQGWNVQIPETSLTRCTSVKKLILFATVAWR
jgi:hypothetical protein